MVEHIDDIIADMGQLVLDLLPLATHEVHFLFEARRGLTLHLLKLL